MRNKILKTLALAFLVLIPLAVWATPTTIAVQAPIKPGTTPATAGTQITWHNLDVANGNTFTNDGQTIAIIRNTTGTITATAVVPATLGGYTVTAPTITINAGSATTATMTTIGPLPSNVFNSSGKATITWSGFSATKEAAGLYLRMAVIKVNP